MTNATKGALLSALGFPGLGQIALKHYRRGVALLLATLAGLGVTVAAAAREARSILESIASEGGVIDQEAVSRAIAQSTDWAGNPVFTLLLFAIALVWVYAAVDAYRIGKQRDLGPG